MRLRMIPTMATAPQTAATADKSQGEAETREGAGCRENEDVFFVHIETPFG